VKHQSARVAVFASRLIYRHEDRIMNPRTAYRTARRPAFQTGFFDTYDPELEALLQRLEPETGSAPSPGTNRDSRKYISWVQRTLNAALGLRLTVDGILGPATRSAIRSFQQRHGLTPDGIVGPATEQRLRLVSSPTAPTPCPPKPVFVDCPPPGYPFEILDEFVFDRSDLVRPRHEPGLKRIAEAVVASQGTYQPIRTILIAGHTDVIGDDNYNFGLGWRRANTVLFELCKVLNDKSPGCTAGLTFQLTSCGERQPKATDKASRRVEVFFPDRP
jgi:Putative peptidoglycan binding domain/OmpA family